MNDTSRVDWSAPNVAPPPKKSRVAHCMNCGHVADWHQPDCTSGKCDCPRFKKTVWRFGILDNLERDIPLSHIVYYIGDPTTQLVKIGSTRRMQSRLLSHRRIRPQILLLATEPGDGELEHDRHRQFEALRNPLATGEREWFRKAPILMEHIGELRLRHGILSSDKPIQRSWIAPLAAGYREPINQMTRKARP